jgi:hypothetical protein
MINLSIETARRPGLREDKRTQGVEHNLSGELEFFLFELAVSP